MQVDILIDQFTECLIERLSGVTVETRYIKRNIPLSREECDGWKFNWNTTLENGYSVYELFVEGCSIVQGRISLKIEGGVANIDIAETAPHNYGHEGKYVGVGAHLFAIACKESLDAGFDGVVAFDSKSNLVEYYIKALGAVEIYPRRLVIFEEAAKKLLDRYIRK